MGTSISTVMSSAIPTMVDVALKGAVLLALAGLATAALWRASAAVRHLVWSLTMAGLLALPLLSALLPQWRVLPQWSALRAPAPAAARATAPLTPTVTPPPENTPPVAPETAFMPTPVQSPATRASDSPSVTKPARPWSDWLLPFWIVGAALMLLPVIVGRLALWRLGRSARPIGSGAWTALLQTLMQQMRLRRGIILLETDRPVMPMAWGIRRARVLVPAESENWTSERRRAVLLHEIAHVRRRDCLTQFLTNLACAMHWFNPLAWLARRRMVAERERACDDLVLAAGFEPSDYARHLLQIASSLRGGLLTSAAAIAMARPSKLEGRLLAVLDGKRSRRGLTRSLVLAGLVLTLGIAVPLACLRPQGPDAKSPEGGKEAKTAASGFLAAFPGGGTIELVGVSYNPSKGKPWWKPDGTPLSPGFVTSGASVSPAPGSKDQPREFVMRAEGLPEGSSSPTWKLEPTGNSAGGQGGVMGDDGKLAADLNMIAVEIPKSAKSVTVKIGVATGDWQDVDQCPPGETLFSGRQDFGVSFAQGYEQKGKATMTVSHNLKDQDVRLIAVDLKGGEHASSGTRSGGVAFFSQITATFDLPLDHVKVFRLQSRPYQWVEFHDVALAPSRAPGADDTAAPTEKAPEKETKERAMAESTPAPPDDAATLVGQVVDKDTGAPLADVTVRSIWRPTASTKTDKEGRFRLAGVKRDQRRHGEVAIEILPAGYAGEYVFLEPAAGEIFERTIRLGREAVVAGRVTDASGNPLADVEVRGGSGGTRGVPGLELKTDAEGRYTMRHVPRGQPLWVGVEKKGYLYEQTHMDVPADAGTLTHDFVLKPGPTISGIVVDQAGTPLEGVKVTGAAGRPGEAETTSDANGRFALRGLSVELDGHLYDVSAVKDGYAIACTILNRDNATEATKLLLTLKPEKTIRGVVADEAGKPVPEVSVSAHGPAGTWNAVQAKTDETGAFTIGKLDEGRYDLVAWREGFPDQALHAVQAGATDVRLVLRKGASLAGRVVDAKTGAPVQLFSAMAQISRITPIETAADRLILGLGSWNELREFQDINGCFEFNKPWDKSHSFRLIIVAPGFCVADVDGVMPGTQAEIRLQKKSVVVHVVDAAAGNDIDRAAVRFHYWTASYPWDNKRDPMTGNDFLLPFEPKALGQGRYEFSSVGSGPWLLKVTAERYAPYMEFFNDGPGERKELDVKLQKQSFLWDGMPPQ